MKIYLAEDSALLRMRLEAMLSRLPNVQFAGIATDAAEAIEGIVATRPDVAIVDINLRGGTGFDVLRAVRQQAPGVEVYMLSNFATQPYRRLAAELGAADFFDKSTEFEGVRDRIAERAAQAA